MSTGIWLFLLAGLGALGSGLLMFRIHLLLKRSPRAASASPRGAVLAACGLILVSFILNGVGFSISSRDPLKWPDNKMTEVRGLSFANQTLPLDGVAYTQCKFTNVTFEYNGTASFKLVDNFMQHLQVTTKSDAVSATVQLLRGLGMLNQDAAIGLDPKLRLHEQ